MRISMPLAITVAAALMTNGCGLAFMGLGSAVPRYATISRADVSKGDEIRVQVASLAHEPVVDLSGSPGLLSGRYAGIEEGKVVVVTSEGSRSFAPSELSKIEIREGSQWKNGLLIGSAVDVGIVTLLVVAAATSTPSFSVSAPGGTVPIMR